MPRTKTTSARKTASKTSAAGDVVDLDNYAPAYLSWIANKLSSGASQAYLAAFDVGIESWRVLVLLAIEGSISAQKACGVIGMDKASMSRCFKSLQERGFIKLSLDPQDGRARIVRLTERGRALQAAAHQTSRELEADWAQCLGEERFADLRTTLQDMIAAGALGSRA